MNKNSVSSYACSFVFHTKLVPIMGTFNNLIVEVVCASCSTRYKAGIQFKYAHTWLLDYRIGDKLEWFNERYDIGAPGKKLVKMYGVLGVEHCPQGCVVGEEEFDIILRNDVLESYRKIEKREDYLDGNGEYFVIEH